jgi:hypothetical protein
MATPRPRKRPAPCPECGGPTVLEGRFCKGCGWDAELASSGDAYLDGVDIPQGYGPDEDTTPADPPKGKRVLWTVLALLALAGFVVAEVLSR